MMTFERFWTLTVLALLALALTGSACRRKSLAEERITPATAPMAADALKKRVQEKRSVQVRTLAAHARLYVEGEDVAADASANLIWVRDSVLWLNIKKFGMEVSRALITPDSFFLLNRVDKTVLAASRQEFQQRYHLPEGLPILQHLLLAEAWLPDMVAFQADIKDSLHRLSGADGRFLLDYRIEEGAFWLRQSTFLQPAEGQWLSQTYARYQKLPRVGAFFPYFRRLELFSPESGYFRADIDFTHIEVNVDKSFRFDIPDHYHRLP
ncbi:MAG: DUF4292 domain-containing protein [Saprospiraceae bacterium]|nr:DUF4292 domain-containing protein [Saprospiraceae bacterium]MDW8230285.1 DUF4292 domain-containing protein [Saprospiraceae bacterium]